MQSALSSFMAISFVTDNMVPVSSKIKVAFVIDTIESPTAGTEKQLLLLLDCIDRKRFEPYLCVLRSSEWLENKFNTCTLYDVGIQSFKSLSIIESMRSFVTFLRREGIQIVHTFFVDANKVGVVAAKLAGVDEIVSSRRNQGYWQNWQETLFLKLLNGFVPIFIANSQSTAEWAQRKEGIPAEKIKVVHNGLQLDSYPVSSSLTRHAFRNSLAVGDDVTLIGIVANLRPIKGIDVFLRAAHIIKGSYPAAKFVVVGDGAERVRLESLVDELRLRKDVTFAGKRHDIPAILPAFDIGLLSSHSESFSNAITEYMAAGLPVICTDVGGAREAIIDGFNGYVVPPGDHVTLAQKTIQLLEEGQLVQFGLRSRERAKELFSCATMVSGTEDIYLDLVGSKR